MGTLDQAAVGLLKVASPSAEPAEPSGGRGQGGRRPGVEICEANTTPALDITPGRSVPIEAVAIRIRGKSTRGERSRNVTAP